MADNVTEGPWLTIDDEKWQTTLDVAANTYRHMRQRGVPERDAIRLVIAGLIDAIRDTYNI